MCEGLSIPYFAGFFDGEGSIGVYPNGRGSYFLRVQITQTDGYESDALMREVRETFGGNLSRHVSLSKRDFWMYQVNSNLAAQLLLQIIPYLRLKCAQAEIAAGWQLGRAKPSRDARGRMMSTHNPLDPRIAEIVQRLKTEPYDAVMAAQTDLVEPVHELRQVVVVKG
jgi:hypothetical protein